MSGQRHIKTGNDRSGRGRYVLCFMNEFEKKIYDQAFDCWKRHMNSYSIWSDSVVFAQKELDEKFSENAIERLMNCITKKLGYKDLSDRYAKVCHMLKEKYDL